MSLDEILQSAIAAGVSDVHLLATTAPRWRLNGKIGAIPDAAPLSPKELVDWHAAERPGKSFNPDDFSVRRHDRTWRVNSAQADSGPKLTLRLVPASIPDFATLGIPSRYIEEVERLRGLHLVTGPTGSGKSTTLAAVIRHLSRLPIHIVTLEDPIEYRHPLDTVALIVQRQLGVDFESFNGDALRGVLRQDPDVILFGELRDRETVRAALTAAETGHMVFATLHNDTAGDAVSRILDACADGSGSEHAAQVSKQLTTVLAQRLVPTRAGSRVAAFECLHATDAVRSLIRQKMDAKIPDEIERGTNAGMISFARSFADLVRTRRITRETALQFVPNAKTFSHLCPA